MHIVPTKISDTIAMAAPEMKIEDDLEDGEIESDGEDYVPPVANDAQNEDTHQEPPQHFEPMLSAQQQQGFYPKSGKKKKSKSKEQKYKDKNKKNRKFVSPSDDDFAGNIAKAIRKAMNKDEDDYKHDDDGEERRKPKKRKKFDKNGPSKKRKKQSHVEDVDESEMMCVRGASPVQRNSPVDIYGDEDKDSYASDSSNDSRGQQQQRPQRQRQQRERNKNKNDRRRQNAHPLQDPDGVCLYFMQGKCHKGDDCIYSHDAQPPRKMELCKFYLMDCCAKRDKCLYMHADFPCKYYHTGLPCIFKDDCKFAHGAPLNENLKNILLKHIESAPKEILGDFPRLNREGAMKMIQNTQARLIQQFSEHVDNSEKGIPSLFELNIPNPQQNLPESLVTNTFNNDRQTKVSPKVRQSRWQNDMGNQNLNISPVSNANTTNVLNIKNLSGVLTPSQISDLTQMGIENLDQLGQLTVIQLNRIGISLKQITEIQLNTMNIQKLGLINPDAEQQQQPFLPTAGSKDLDLRVAPPVTVSSNVNVATDLPGRDIDMRFHQSVSLPAKDDSTLNISIKKDSSLHKDMIDIDQYTKDALKFVSKDKENIDVSNDTFDSDKPTTGPTSETKDVDHRVLPFSEDSIKIPRSVIDDHFEKKRYDTDIRFLRPEPIFPKSSPDKRHRRSTTDDEDNNLLIDEKWYSSDEEKSSKRKSPASSPRSASTSSPAPAPHVIEPSAVLSRLGDLSKIDISEEVTKLLQHMKNNAQENKMENSSDISASNRPRDPRSKKSPDKNNEALKAIPKKPARVSIYECIDGEPTDGRRRTDVDLRQTDFPSFGDTDLRQGTSGDIDLRLGLPFKAIPNYTPASEIDGSINSHPPIPYKLSLIHIPRPDYTDIRNSTAKSQALVDPRLRKVFRLSIDDSNSDSEKTVKPAVPAGPRVDPRRKQTDTLDISNQEKPNPLDIQTILQNSNWFRDLSSNQKIFVNQHLMPVTQMIKQFQQEKAAGKSTNIDLTSIQSNSAICSIFTNLGITLNENGEYAYLPKPKDALLKTPANFNPSINPFGMNTGVMDTPNMNMMNMNMQSMSMGVGNMNVGPMPGYNQAMPDPRGGPTPGLLGIAPNIPHNFNNFPPNFGNMPFNGPNPNNYGMNSDQNYPRFPPGGGPRGRGNDRWNRGGSGRANRDRKNFNDRGNWKN